MHCDGYDGRACASAFWTRALLSTLSPCRLPPSATALTLLSREKTILRAACGGQVAHVLIHIMRQEGCGRGG